MNSFFDKFKNTFAVNTGFDDHIGGVGERLMSKKGKANVRKVGYHRLKHISLFHLLIDINIYLFWLICFLGFISINIIFGGVYYFIGPTDLSVDPSLSSTDIFLECFYFSAQTLTSVGYGRLAPNQNAASTVAAFESFFGLLSFAVITGLLYARFSKPKAHLEFSKKAIIRPFKEKQALMFRFATYKNNDLTDVSCQVIAAFAQTTEGIRSNKFISLKLEIDHIQELVLNWTIVHLIDEESPLFGMSQKDIEEAKLELIILVKGYDEDFSANVQERHSYRYDEFDYNVQFVKMFYPNANKSRTILDIDKISQVEKIA